MEENIKIWLVGNTGLRNPNRIQEGLAVYAKSAFVGKLHGRDNEIGFMNLLNKEGIIQNENGKDESGSHARKWRLMFAKNGYIYPQVSKKDGNQNDLGDMDDITPFGRVFLKADTFPAIQECFLRAMSVEQFQMPDKTTYFSPLRWMLAIMLELEKRTGSTEMSRIEFALWGHTTNPSYNLSEVVDHILDLRQRRAKAPAKRTFDKNEIKERGKYYDKKSENFTDYCDMNMRYLRISGMFQRKGRGIMIVPAKHLLAEKLAKSTATSEPLMDAYKQLCSGAPLPTDNLDVAKTLLEDLKKQMKERHVKVLLHGHKHKSIVAQVTYPDTSFSNENNETQMKKISVIGMGGTGCKHTQNLFGTLGFDDNKLYIKFYQIYSDESSEDSEYQTIVLPLER